jgi:hypothetical protein
LNISLKTENHETENKRRKSQTGFFKFPIQVLFHAKLSQNFLESKKMIPSVLILFGSYVVLFEASNGTRKTLKGQIKIIILGGKLFLFLTGTA